MDACSTELWSLGTGATRMFCLVSRTDDGFAVDLFRGDTCIHSEEFDDREAAVRAAVAAERRYLRRMVKRREVAARFVGSHARAS